MTSGFQLFWYHFWLHSLLYVVKLIHVQMKNFIFIFKLYTNNLSKFLPFNTILNKSIYLALVSISSCSNTLNLSASLAAFGDSRYYTTHRLAKNIRTTCKKEKLNGNWNIHSYLFHKRVPRFQPVGFNYCFKPHWRHENFLNIHSYLFHKSHCHTRLSLDSL